MHGYVSVVFAFRHFLLRHQPQACHQCQNGGDEKSIHEKLPPSVWLFRSCLAHALLGFAARGGGSAIHRERVLIMRLCLAAVSRDIRGGPDTSISFHVGLRGTFQHFWKTDRRFRDPSAGGDPRQPIIGVRVQRLVIALFQ
jgi:hypothetical protein